MIRDLKIETVYEVTRDAIPEQFVVWLIGFAQTSLGAPVALFDAKKEQRVTVDARTGATAAFRFFSATDRVPHWGSLPGTGTAVNLAAHTIAPQPEDVVESPNAQLLGLGWVEESG